MPIPESDRRSVLKGIGSIGILGGLAGCSGGDGGDGGSDGGDGSDGSDGGGGGSGPLVTGAPQGLSGKYSSLVPPVVDAIKLAEKQVNDAGGIDGRDLKIKVENSGWSVEEARPAMNQLVNVDNALILFGMQSSTIPPLWDTIQTQQVPMLSGWPGSTFLNTKGGDMNTPKEVSDDQWVWRTVPSDTNKNLGGAYWLQEEKGYNSISFLHGSTQGESSNYSAMKEAWEALGGSVNHDVQFRRGQGNFQTELTQIFENNPGDVVFIAAASTSFTTIMKQFDQLGYSNTDAQIFANAGVVNDSYLQENWQPYLEGIIGTISSPGGPNQEQFTEQYAEFTDKEPNLWTYGQWDSCMVGALAMVRAKRDYGEITRTSIEKCIGPVARPDGTEVSTFEKGKAELEAGNEINFQGATSNANFDQYGNVSAAVEVKQVSSNKSLKTIDSVPLQKVDDLRTQVYG